MRSTITLLASVLAVGRAVAQSVTPFTLDGSVDDVSSDSASFNSGGSISVLGHAIKVPANLIVQFPATWVSFKDFAAAKAEIAGYEVKVTGNFVDGVPIAGMIEISQLLLGGGEGIVESISYDGTMKLVGGPTLRINTPNGVFAKAYTDRPLFTADEENPSITAFSGFPMCIPRSSSDPDCPSENRPTGQRVFRAPKPLDMAPFAPGDWVTYSGIKNGGSEILCYEINAENVQITTSADAGEPVYLRVEDCLIGIFDGSANTEVADNRYIGYISDPSATIQVFGLDTDACTGKVTDRQVGSGAIKAGDVRNKFVIRPTDSSNTKGAREYRFKASKGAHTTNQGIKAGQYVTPITEIVWPEVSVPGTPPVPNAFQLFGNLANGIVQDKHQFGQLKPWPGASAPTVASTCTGNELDPQPEPTPSGSEDTTPIADAGADQLLPPGTTVTLAALQNNTLLKPANVTYTWTQTLPSGEALALKNNKSSSCTFNTPFQASTTPSVVREFEVNICLVGDDSKCSKDTVKVTTNTTVKDTVTITGYQWVSSNGGRLTISAASNVNLKSTQGAQLKLYLGTTTTPIAMTQDSTNGSLYTYARTGSGKQPASITIRSALGGSDTRSALLRRWARGLLGT